MILDLRHDSSHTGTRHIVEEMYLVSLQSPHANDT